MITAWFPTLIYSEPLRKAGAGKFNAALAAECRALRAFDAAGRKWSQTNYPGGYTSYASMNELHRFSSTFEGLERKITRRVKEYAKARTCRVIRRSSPVKVLEKRCSSLSEA